MIKMKEALARVRQELGHALSAQARHELEHMENLVGETPEYFYRLVHVKNWAALLARSLNP